jgi:hypothetical protein
VNKTVPAHISELQERLPSELRAANQAEVGTLVVIDCFDGMSGYWTNFSTSPGAIGANLGPAPPMRRCEVGIVDAVHRRMLAETESDGMPSYPQAETPPPYDKILQYLTCILTTKDTHRCNHLAYY